MFLTMRENPIFMLALCSMLSSAQVPTIPTSWITDAFNFIRALRDEPPLLDANPRLKELSEKLYSCVVAHLQIHDYENMLQRDYLRFLHAIDEYEIGTCYGALTSDLDDEFASGIETDSNDQEHARALQRDIHAHELAEHQADQNEAEYQDWVDNVLLSLYLDRVYSEELH